jgi:hypothetical protein
MVLEATNICTRSSSPSTFRNPQLGLNLLKNANNFTSRALQIMQYLLPYCHKLTESGGQPNKRGILIFEDFKFQRLIPKLCFVQ